VSARDVIADVATWRGTFDDAARYRDAGIILAALAAAGFAVVPVEPSVEMLQVGYDAGRASRHSGVSGQTIDASVRAMAHRESAIYRAMLAAGQEDAG
jgi:hypothetical protein